MRQIQFLQFLCSKYQIVGDKRHRIIREINFFQFIRNVGITGKHFPCYKAYFIEAQIKLKNAILKSRNGFLTNIITYSRDKQSSNNPCVLLSIFSISLWERSKVFKDTNPESNYNYRQGSKTNWKCSPWKAPLGICFMSLLVIFNTSNWSKPSKAFTLILLSLLLAKFNSKTTGSRPNAARGRSLISLPFKT